MPSSRNSSQLTAEDEARRLRTEALQRLRRLYHDSVVISVDDRRRTGTNTDPLIRMWKRIDPDGEKRQAWCREHGREPDTPFELYGFSWSEMFGESRHRSGAPSTKPTKPRGRPPSRDRSRKGDPALLAGKTSVAIATAVDYLGLTLRRVQQLMADDGPLEVVGKGHSKTITVRSLMDYVPPKEKAN